MFGNQLRVPVSPPRATEEMRTERRNKEKKVKERTRGKIHIRVEGRDNKNDI